MEIMSGVKMFISVPIRVTTLQVTVLVEKTVCIESSDELMTLLT